MKRLQITITEEAYKLLKLKSYTTDESKSEIINNLIEEHIIRYEKKEN